VAQGNIDKLMQRYPEGFSTERSINRNEHDTGPASLNEVANEHVIYLAQNEGLRLAESNGNEGA